MKAERVTVSIPRETLAAVDRTRRRLGKTRSAIVAEALKEWLRSRDVRDMDRRYIEAYRRHPERAVGHIAATAAGEWKRWED